MRLKVEGQEFAVCAYTKAQDVESFRRRAYWLKEDPRHVLVHYLDEAGKYQQAQEEGHSRETARSESGSLTADVPAIKDEVPIFEEIPVAKPQESFFDHPQLFEEEMLTDRSLDLFRNDLSMPLFGQKACDMRGFPSSSMMSMASSEDLLFLQNQISSLQQRFDFLEQSMRHQVSMGPPRIEVVDFSPEWDYVEGGAKVLVCLNPHSAVEQVLRQSALNEAKFSVAFGLAEPVQVTFLQPGVLRCYAPKHEPGSVPLRLLFNGQPTCLMENT